MTFGVESERDASGGRWITNTAVSDFCHSDGDRNKRHVVYIFVVRLSLITWGARQGKAVISWANLLGQSDIDDGEGSRGADYPRKRPLHILYLYNEKVKSWGSSCQRVINSILEMTWPVRHPLRFLFYCQNVASVESKHGIVPLDCLIHHWSTLDCLQADIAWQE